MNNLDRLLDETLASLAKGQGVRKGERRVEAYSGARMTFDGMKLARELALLSFYNATCEYVPKKILRKMFEEFYEDLDKRIIKVGDTGNFDEEKDSLFGAITNVLRLLGIPKEKWRYFV